LDQQQLLVMEAEDVGNKELQAQEYLEDLAEEAGELDMEEHLQKELEELRTSEMSAVMVVGFRQILQIILGVVLVAVLDLLELKAVAEMECSSLGNQLTMLGAEEDMDIIQM
jgi:hypothetical protein